jgi:Flp pilus assembly pilin Flp
LEKPSGFEIFLYRACGVQAEISPIALGYWEVFFMLRKLWNDEAGIVALEYLLTATIASLALVVGLAAVGHALNTELTELASAIITIDQTYSYAGYSTCLSSANGAANNDDIGVMQSSNFNPTAGNGTTVFCTGVSP